MFKRFLLIFLLPNVYCQNPCSVLNQTYIKIIETEIKYEGEKEERRCPLNDIDNDLLFHQVCYELDDDDYDIIKYVHGTINSDSIGKGTDPVQRAKQFVRVNTPLCGQDDAGHIIPKVLGGKGGPSNIFPQNSNLNQRLWKQACDELLLHIRERPYSKTVDVQIVFKYKPGSNRPWIFLYKFIFLAENSAVERTVYGFFENQNYLDATLERCSHPTMANTIYNYAANMNNYFSKRSCQPQQNPSNEYGPRIPLNQN
uniref:Type VII secretion system protein EssD-like domain-containing protein n=1 Tax=Panagrolaimus superbus TaxID=310955 RepID=A0A914XSQ6_9BILA